MKRYALFAGYNYYAEGGWGDYIAVYATFDEARKVIVDTQGEDDKKGKSWQRWSILDDTYDWYQIVDLQEQIIVEKN